MNKTSLRTLRENCGYSRADIESTFGYEEQLIREWESSRNDSFAPDDYIEFLENLNTTHLQTVKKLVDDALNSREESDSAPYFIRIFYGQHDMLKRPFRSVNLDYMNAGQILESLGKTVIYTTNPVKPDFNLIADSFEVIMYRTYEGELDDAIGIPFDTKSITQAISTFDNLDPEQAFVEFAEGKMEEDIAGWGFKVYLDVVLNGNLIEPVEVKSYDYDTYCLEYTYDLED